MMRSKNREPVSAHPEESNVPERELSGISANQIPGEPERRKQGDAEKNLKQVVVVA
jgi:hypothetical protein